MVSLFHLADCVNSSLPLIPTNFEGDMGKFRETRENSWELIRI